MGLPAEWRDAPLCGMHSKFRRLVDMAKGAFLITCDREITARAKVFQSKQRSTMYCILCEDRSASNGLIQIKRL